MKTVKGDDIDERGWLEDEKLYSCGETGKYWRERLIEDVQAVLV